MLSHSHHERVEEGLEESLGEHLVEDMVGTAQPAVLLSYPQHPVERHSHEEDTQEQLRHNTRGRKAGAGAVSFCSRHSPYEGRHNHGIP